MHKVWLLLLPGFLLVDVMDLRAVFKAVNASRRARKRVAGYDVRLASATGGSVLSSSGVALSTSVIPRDLVGRPSTLFISGEPHPTSAGPTGLRRLREWLCDNRRHLSRCAVQGAEALLPRAPQLYVVHRRGRAAPQASRLGRPGQALFKACTTTRDWRVIEPGQGTDLALSWIEEDRGIVFVNALASHLPRPRSRRYGMPRHSARPIDPPAPDARIAALHRWIAIHLHEQLGVARLAQEVHMSTRSFARFYERTTGLSPGRGLQQIRLDCACHGLETSTRPLKTIAAQCGYGSPEVMRRAFVRDLQMTPREYRRRHATTKDAGAA
ncbi:transcriptional regulator GlxA family with amidase domain [Variovorax boronicumulans]|uniref:helix-turn-helix domain-containing protein n=1 Tax=Variovorax boronicumulans TaxID=436515 RepID=UPI00277E4B54|nr:helix-turn-helix domain-containing protein [Variovorax boronicumulans]MDP9912472.1 transcriptional regulator GlxA family with amidase domain [Variovorax boronicumulans]